MNKKSGLKSDVKRKLVTGTIEVIIGLGILIFSWVTDASLYLYAGILFAASGAFTLVICILRIFADKKMAQKQVEQEQSIQTTENVVEVAEEVKEKEQAQPTSQDSSDTEK